jgi:hypothetical protein
MTLAPARWSSHRVGAINRNLLPAVWKTQADFGIERATDRFGRKAAPFASRAPRTGESFRWHFDPERGLVIEIPPLLQDASNRPSKVAHTFKIEVEDAAPTK